MTGITDARFDEIRKLNARPSETCDAHTLGQYIDANRDLINEVNRLRAAPGDEGLTDEIEEALHDLETWGTAYPTDIFPEPTKEQIEAMIAVTAPADGVARVAAANARHLYKVRGPKLIDLIRRLSASYRAACGERDAARAAYEMKVQDFARETLRASGLHALVSSGIQLLKDDHESGAWSRDCQRCAWVVAARAVIKPTSGITCKRCGETFAETPDGCRDFDCPLKE